MIQRRQSLYLLAMAVICIIMLIADSPISSGTFIFKEKLKDYAVSIYGAKGGSDSYLFENKGLVFSMFLGSLLFVVSILAFKNLKLQARIVFFNFVVIALMLFLMAESHLRVVNDPGNPVQSVNYQYAPALVIILAVLNFLSYRSIKKDIELLASVDRLR